MSRTLSSYVEVVVPMSRTSLEPVTYALDAAVLAVGGCTLTEQRGYYKREDTGEVEYEEVFTARYDFDIDSPNLDAMLSAIRNVVQALLDAGEESVLRRRYYSPSRATPFAKAPGYKSELIFR